MRNKFSLSLTLVLATLALATLLAATRAVAQTESVLYNFGPSPDGDSPEASLIADAAGNLYGTTAYGGAYGNYGTVFQLSPAGGGKWIETVLHSFNNDGIDGYNLYGNLLLDSEGNLYGTAAYGGTGRCNGGREIGCGIVFELLPQSDGSWSEKILHNFGSLVNDAAIPTGGLTFDSKGNLFGLTSAGGDGPNNGVGAAFELIAEPDGSWREVVLHSFGHGTDGFQPQGNLTFDNAGNLYGTNYTGGAHGYGTLFELLPRSNGTWEEKILHSFQSNKFDAIAANGTVIFDRAGNLYGTSYLGGIDGGGTVFEFSPQTGGSWRERILYNFGNGTDGLNPNSTVAFDASGNLYGTTYFGGEPDAGIVYELKPSTGGNWGESILHSFVGGANDGGYPVGGVTLGAAGAIYGTTSARGEYGNGAVYEVTP